MTPDAQYARDPSSITAILDQFEDEGFSGQFAVREDGRIACLACGEEHPAASVEMHALRRTEGASDPADMLAVVALCCPNCATQGTAVLNYGPEATVDDAEILVALEDERRGSGTELGD